MAGRTYTLSGTPGPGSRFNAWGTGDCDKILSDGSCRIAMSRTQTKSAHFIRDRSDAPVLTVNRSGTGAGLVGARRFANSSIVGICSGYPCRVAAPSIGTYDFIAVPDASAKFNGWVTSQCDSVLSTGECRVRINGPATVTAKFSPK